MDLHVKHDGALCWLSGDGLATLGDANRFLDTLRIRGLSQATIRAYAFDLVMLGGWLTQSGRRAEDLDQAGLLDFIAYQRQSGAQPNSINRRLTTTLIFYRFLTGRDLPGGARVTLPAPYYKGPPRDHVLGLHPVPRQRRLKLRVKTARKVVRPLTPSQVKTFLLTLKRYRDLAIVYLMLFCGLRSCEVLSLRLSDLDMADQRMRVRGKGSKERVLPLPNVLASVVADYLRVERPSTATTDHLFVVLQGRRRGEAMTASGLRRLFRHRRLTRKGITNANPHRFRHTFGTDMACAGVRLPILQRMMGHVDGKTTLQYINLSMADIAKEYVRALAEIEKHYDQE